MPCNSAVINRPADPALASVITAISMMLTSRSCGECRVMRVRVGHRQTDAEQHAERRQQPRRRNLVAVRQGDLQRRRRDDRSAHRPRRLAIGQSSPAGHDDRSRDQLGGKRQHALEVVADTLGSLRHRSSGSVTGKVSH